MTPTSSSRDAHAAAIEEASPIKVNQQIYMDMILYRERERERETYQWKEREEDAHADASRMLRL
jgi:hypothetical protein